MERRLNALCWVSDVRLIISRSRRILDAETAPHGERIAFVMTRGCQVSRGEIQKQREKDSTGPHAVSHGMNTQNPYGQYKVNDNNGK